ncbi:MAG: hypothetical protein Faunusvirus5_10 [Faunusvirus sp.]|jgi:ankyrin repeat protein|uniref:Uncharacterized protein n=1 Tax=Faunusvirus sp. TaxID=2487766 RepID=A0A3G4ZYW8_9VIRU|nr:MAG: hypothetical protein Faunusvirus5_10 [Faunusvirus sp.]
MNSNTISAKLANIAELFIEYVNDKKIDQCHELIDKYDGRFCDISVSAGKFNNMTPIIYACYRRNESLALALIAKSEMLNAVDNTNSTALIYACYNGLHIVANELICRGVDLNIVDVNKYTALQYAYSSDMMSTLELLLDNKADTSCLYQNGDNILINACKIHDNNIAMKILNYNIDLNIQNILQQTALMFACKKKTHIDIVKKLIHKGAKLDLTDWWGDNALQYAGDSNNIDAMRELINSGISLNQQNTQKISVLIHACRDGFESGAELLIDSGANLDLQDNSGWTALIYACKDGLTYIVKKLIHAKCNMNLRGNYGWTALMHACYNNRSDIAKYLLSNGCDATLQNRNGYTAMYYAYDLTDVIINMINLGVDFVNFINGDTYDNKNVMVRNHIFNIYKKQITAVIDNDETNAIQMCFKKIYAIELVDIICEFIL